MKEELAIKQRNILNLARTTKTIWEEIRNDVLADRFDIRRAWDLNRAIAEQIRRCEEVLE